MTGPVTLRAGAFSRSRSLGTVGLLALCGLACVLAGLPAASAIASAGGVVPAQARAHADHVVLISVDGFRPTFYLEDRWPAPMLRRMAAEGAHALGVVGVYPSVTYPSHTTMITGALPARHGVFYNTPFEPEGATGRWYWEESSIRVPTLWDAVRAAGLKSAGFSWPVSVGAPVDWNVPEVWTLDESVDPVEYQRSFTEPEGHLAELEREATGKFRASDFGLGELSRDDRAGAVVAWWLENRQPALLNLHIVGTDHFQHEVGTEGHMVQRAVAAADRAIARIVEAGDRAGVLDRTAFVITGDHGHVDVHTLLAPNVWLTQAGLMEDRPDRGGWRATFHTGGAAAFLHLADPSDTAAGVEARKVLDELPRGVRRQFRVLGRERLDELGADPAAVLALDPVAGVAFTSSASGPAVRSAEGATHGYVPDRPEIHTGFVAWGAGIRSGVVVPEMGLVDIAPLVAALLDVELDPPDGVLLPGILDESAGGVR